MKAWLYLCTNYSLYIHIRKLTRQLNIISLAIGNIKVCIYSNSLFCKISFEHISYSKILFFQWWCIYNERYEEFSKSQINVKFDAIKTIKKHCFFIIFFFNLFRNFNVMIFKQTITCEHLLLKYIRSCSRNCLKGYFDNTSI